MTDQEKEIEHLREKVKLLEKIVELQEMVAKAGNQTPYVPVWPSYPAQPITVYPTVTYSAGGLIGPDGELRPTVTPSTEDLYPSIGTAG